MNVINRGVVPMQLCVSKLNHMQTLRQTYHPTYAATRKPSIFTQFITWCNNQEQYRYGWLAAILTIHGCVLTPLASLSIAGGSNNIALWGMAIAAMGMCLITNLAAMPTKITIPIFFISILIDLAIVGLSLGSLLS
jgi:hypothetical protein